MSQLPKKKSIRKVPAEPLSEEVDDGYGESEYDKDPMPVPPVGRGGSRVQHPARNQPAPTAANAVQSAKSGGSGGRSSVYDLQSRGSKGGGYQARNAPPRRDIFPYIMGAVIGAVVVGLMGLTYLLGTGSRSSGTIASVPQNPIQPVTGNSVGQATQPAQGAASSGEPPRIPIAEFKALYDDPAKRPMIIDVRAAQAYDQGHIKGAVSFPESDVDTQVAELPKNKLVVAYCQ